MKYFLASLIVFSLLGGCSTVAKKTVEVKVPVPIVSPCDSKVPKPGMCVPKNDSRVEWLRCTLMDHERLKAYASELEATLKACQ